MCLPPTYYTWPFHHKPIFSFYFFFFFLSFFSFLLPRTLTPSIGLKEHLYVAFQAQALTHEAAWVTLPSTIGKAKQTRKRCTSAPHRNQKLSTCQMTKKYLWIEYFACMHASVRDLRILLPFQKIKVDIFLSLFSS